MKILDLSQPLSRDGRKIAYLGSIEDTHPFVGLIKETDTPILFDAFGSVKGEPEYSTKIINEPAPLRIYYLESVKKDGTRYRLTFDSFNQYARFVEATPVDERKKVAYFDIYTENITDMGILDVIPEGVENVYIPEPD